MCIIAVQTTKEKTVPREEFDACGSSNKDGFGIMYAKGGDIVIQKTLEYKNAWDMYQEAIASEAYPIVLHWRIGTGGGKGLNMCHPFTDDKRDWALVHNGIMYATQENTNIESDTSWFAREIVSKSVEKYGASIIANVGVNALIKQVCGGDKMVFMDRKGTLGFINKDKFVTEHEGTILYSNSSYKSWRAPLASGTAIVKTVKYKCCVCDKEIAKPYGSEIIQFVRFPKGVYSAEYAHEQCVATVMDELLNAKLRAAIPTDEFDDDDMITTEHARDDGSLDRTKFATVEDPLHNNVIELFIDEEIIDIHLYRTARSADLVLIRETWPDGVTSIGKYCISTGCKIATVREPR